MTYSQQYYLENRKTFLARSKKWRQDNRDKYNETRRRWSKANREKELKYSRAWRAKNPEKHESILQKSRDHTVILQEKREKERIANPRKLKRIPRERVHGNSKISDQCLQCYLTDGFRQSEIAKMCSLSRQAVHQRIKNASSVK